MPKKKLSKYFSRFNKYIPRVNQFGITSKFDKGPDSVGHGFLGWLTSAGRSAGNQLS